jgi:hypothetical protein
VDVFAPLSFLGNPLAGGSATAATVSGAVRLVAAGTIAAPA